MRARLTSRFKKNTELNFNINYKSKIVDIKVSELYECVFTGILVEKLTFF